MRVNCDDCGISFYAEIDVAHDWCPNCGRTIWLHEPLSNPQQFNHPTNEQFLEAIDAVNRMDVSDCLDNGDWVIENAKMMLRAYTSLKILYRGRKCGDGAI